jgi:hypothetical protein
MIMMRYQVSSLCFLSVFLISLCLAIGDNIRRGDVTTTLESHHNDYHARYQEFDDFEDDADLDTNHDHDHGEMLVPEITHDLHEQDFGDTNIPQARQHSFRTMDNGHERGQTSSAAARELKPKKNRKKKKNKAKKGVAPTPPKTRERK